MGTGDPSLLIGIIFLGVLVTAGALGFALFGGQEALRRRLRKRVAMVQTRWIEDEEAGASLKRNLADSSIPTLDRLIKRIVPPPAQLRRHLARTGRRITLGEYVLANLLLGALAGSLVAAFTPLPAIVALCVAITVGVGLPYFVVGRMAARRMDKFLKLFPDAIELIVRGLKSGLPASESITVVGDEIPDPVGSEFRRITDSMKLGQPLEEALWEAAGRVPLTDFQFFVISLSVQKETGGNLAETLENLANILRRRQQMKLKIRAMSSEARASAYIIGALPFILAVLIYLLNPDYASVLWTDMRGRVLVGIGLFWLSLGAGVMAKMVRFEI